MTTSGKHIIHRETIELSGRHYPSLQRLEKEANRIATSVFQSEIESCFDSMFTGEHHLVIPKLEIDLGVFREGEFEKEAGLRLRIKLSNALSAILSISHFNNTSVDQIPPVYPEKDPSIPSLSSHATLEAFLFFIVHGYLPWWWEPDHTIHDSWKNRIQPEHASSILRMMLKSQSTIPRIVDSLSEEMLGLICVSAGFGKSIHQGWSEIGKNVVGSQKDFDICRNIFWEYCLNRVAGFSSHITKENVIREIARISTLEPEELNFFLISAIEKLNSTPDLTSDLKKSSAEDEQYYNSKLEIRDVSDSTIPTGPEKPHFPFPTESKANGKQNSSQQTQPVSTSPKVNGSEEQVPFSRESEILIQTRYAGIIIVHPFIKELFQERQLLDGNHFASIDTASAAIRMLGYLSTGNEAEPESDLFLPKLLCGLQGSDAISSFIRLSEADTVACDELLYAVVHHWNALGKSSPDALRSGFFSRQGIITMKDNGWLLQVERLAQDILLNRLPWGISTIHLPWMKDTLHVSWI